MIGKYNVEAECDFFHAFCGEFLFIVLETRPISNTPLPARPLFSRKRCTIRLLMHMCMCCPSIQKIDTRPRRRRCDVHLSPKPRCGCYRNSGAISMHCTLPHDCPKIVLSVDSDSTFPCFLPFAAAQWGYER